MRAAALGSGILWQLRSFAAPGAGRSGDWRRNSLQEVGAAGGGALQGLLVAPGGDAGVVAGEQDFGDGLAAELGRAGVVGPVQEPFGAVGVLGGRFAGAED